MHISGCRTGFPVLSTPRRPQAVSYTHLDVYKRQAYAGEESATVEIRDYHSNITKIVKNGKIIFSTDDEQSEQSSGPDKSLLNVKDILEFADCVDLSDISEVISRQIELSLIHI